MAAGLKFPVMRELILNNCDVIHDREIEDILGGEDASNFFIAQGDIDGDGHDEIVVCSHSGPVAIIKRHQVYKISNRSSDHSVCSVHVISLIGNLRSEIVTISLTGLCTVYKFEGLLDGSVLNENKHNFDEKNYTKSKVELIDIPDNDITANNDGKTIVHLTISSRQSGLAKNATAAQTFMYVIRLLLRNVWASFLLL